MDTKDYVGMKVTLGELLKWVKEQITQGEFSEFKDKSDRELLELVKAAKPLIEAELQIANMLAKEQIEAR